MMKKEEIKQTERTNFKERIKHSSSPIDASIKSKTNGTKKSQWSAWVHLNLIWSPQTSFYLHSRLIHTVHESIHLVPKNQTRVTCSDMFSNAICRALLAEWACVREMTKDICQNNKGDVYLSGRGQGELQTDHGRSASSPNVPLAHTKIRFLAMEKCIDAGLHHPNEAVVIHRNNYSGQCYMGLIYPWNRRKMNKL